MMVENLIFTLSKAVNTCISILFEASMLAQWNILCKLGCGGGLDTSVFNIYGKVRWSEAVWAILAL